MALEKAGYWACIVMLLSFATLLSFGIVSAVAEGSVRAFSKYGVGRLYLLNQDPIGFWGAITFHLLFASFFWWFAFWVWQKKIRNECA